MLCSLHGFWKTIDFFLSKNKNSVVTKSCVQFVCDFECVYICCDNRNFSTQVERTNTRFLVNWQHRHIHIHKCMKKHLNFDILHGFEFSGDTMCYQKNQTLLTSVLQLPNYIHCVHDERRIVNATMWREKKSKRKWDIEGKAYVLRGKQAGSEKERESESAKRSITRYSNVSTVSE